MFTRAEFMKIALQDNNFAKAQAFAKKQGTELTLFSTTNVTINALCSWINSSDYNQGKPTPEPIMKLIEQIKEANMLEMDIDEVKAKKSIIQGTTLQIENFFQAIESPDTKERLFIVMGETGVGKSYMIEKRYPSIPQYACSKALDPYTLCYYLSDKDGNGLKPYETPFLKALKYGGLVFLDEMNELPHDTKMFIQGITDEKKAVVVGDEVVKIASNFRIIASLNPPSETDERDPLGDAILGRAVGLVLELTDEIIMSRLNVKKSWLQGVRRLYNYIAQTAMIDIRPLSYRDYQKFIKYGVDSQMKFKFSMGDVKNISEYVQIQETQEYKNILKEIENAK